MHSAVQRSALVVGALALATQATRAQRPSLDSTTRQTWAELLAVHDARRVDTTVIDRALASSVAPLRAAAARVVGMNRIAARYPVLRARLALERDTAAARDAAFALGLAQDAGSCDALRDALASPALGASAAWALGELNTTCGDFTSLLSRAAAGAPRAAMLRAATKWTPFPDSTVVQAYHDATRADERWSALYALARARRAAGASLAVRASRSADPSLRELAARLLTAAMQPAADSLRIVARLDSLMADAAPHVRIAAARSLATYRRLARVPFTVAWRREHDANVRVTLAQNAAAVLADTSAVWRMWWMADTTFMVRRSLISSAWQAGAMPALSGDAAALDTAADYRIRIAMLEGAAAAGGERNITHVITRLDDRDGRVRAAAVAALANLSPAGKEAIGWSTHMANALQDADVGVRAAALSARQREVRTGKTADAIAGFVRAQRDTLSDAREAALDLLTAAWREDSASFTDSVRTALRAWPAPADPLLVRRVQALPPLVHWQGATTAVGAVAEYERIVREIIVPSLRGESPALRMQTDRGVVRILLDGVRTPMTTDHFLRLARASFFRELRFHRVVPAFVAQGGDPRGDGSGGPGYAIRDELNRSPYVRGAVGMALSGPDTGGSQFFLTLAPQPHLDGHYTVFGHVSAGLAAMDALVQGDRMRSIVPFPH